MSAHSRSEYVATLENCVVREAVSELPLARVLMVEPVRSDTAPVPPGPVALWKKYGKELPVPVVPMFVIVPENVADRFCVAVVGVMLPVTVRSGRPEVSMFDPVVVALLPPAPIADTAH